MPDRLSLYDTVAQRAADVVVSEYSTSFGLACRLLAEPCRSRIRAIYALVRLADEVVDGAAAQAGAADTAGSLLDALEAETESALTSGYSTNVLVHAFAMTARQAGISTDLTAPFFASMRMDLHRTAHDEESLREYVYGSAEVVGLMCLRVFLLDRTDLSDAGRSAEYRRLTPGARALGAAFQKVNFLRDLADDSGRLGRSYFVGVDARRLTEAEKSAILADVDADLRLAGQALGGLPRGARRAVGVAHALFAELAVRLHRTPAAQVAVGRVRVPGPVKVRVALRALRGALVAG